MNGLARELRKGARYQIDSLHRDVESNIVGYTYEGITGENDQWDRFVFRHDDGTVIELEPEDILTVLVPGSPYIIVEDEHGDAVMVELEGLPDETRSSAQRSNLR